MEHVHRIKLDDGPDGTEHKPLAHGVCACGHEVDLPNGEVPFVWRLHGYKMMKAEKKQPQKLWVR